MPKIICYAISCSAEGMMDVRKLYVWGEWGNSKSLPLTRSEANKRIKACQKRHKCLFCDAEVHKITVERTKKTFRHGGGQINAT